MDAYKVQQLRKMLVHETAENEEHYGRTLHIGKAMQSQ